MGTSPPTQNAPTYVTDSASRVAAPASAAFPPCSRILMPAAVAAGLPETTTPCLPAATLAPLAVTGRSVACGQATVASSRSDRVAIEMTLRIGVELRCIGGHPLPTMAFKVISTLLSRAVSPSARALLLPARTGARRLLPSDIGTADLRTAPGNGQTGTHGRRQANRLECIYYISV